MTLDDIDLKILDLLCQDGRLSHTAIGKKIDLTGPAVYARIQRLEREGVIEMRHGKGAFVTDSGRRMTAAERDKSLRLLARQLAVEAMQMGAPASQVLKVVREELADLQNAEEVEAPVKVSVVSRR